MHALCQQRGLPKQVCTVTSTRRYRRHRQSAQRREGFLTEHEGDAGTDTRRANGGPILHVMTSSYYVLASYMINHAAILNSE